MGGHDSVRRVMPNFALLGASGFVAPRHIAAIRAVGGSLVAVVDPRGPLREGLPDETRQWEDAADLERAVAAGTVPRPAWISICTPNDLHEAHIGLAFRIGADAICEKPVVVNPAGLDRLAAAERASGRRVATVLQLRHHPRILALRARLPARSPRGRHEVALSFVTRRGPEYFASWKGDDARSGGIAMNIGVHYFDLLLWLFGRAERVEVSHHDRRAMEGTLDLERARVRWLLSVDGEAVHRSLSVDGEEVDFTDVAGDLHAEAYREILAGRGPGLEEARPSVELVDRIRRLAAGA